jgi:protein SCO1/2
MDRSKTTLILLGATVAALGIMTGTFLWVKLAPRPQSSSWSASSNGELTTYGTLPQFALQERSGKPFMLADMRGKVWIADFIYTSCTDTCPMQTAAMARLQDLFAGEPDLRLASFSVDPERDTTEALTRYADRYRATAERWLFLTGSKEAMTRLVQEGFRLSAATFTEADTQEPVILHSPRFVLVDRQSQIRGYYDIRDSAAFDRLTREVKLLIEEKGIR